ncbi:MAG: hypothetical protein ACM3PY_01150, partial [Omnitrophica WOR_2 bacterium]
RIRYMKIPSNRIYLLLSVSTGLILLFVASCSPVLAGLKRSGTPSPEPANTEPVCPQPTAEPFYIEPVTSPTNQITQTLRITIGNGEAISVTNDMGSFYAPASAGKVIVVLAPDQVNELTAYGKVRPMGGECHYGGYTLSTRVDRLGNPLIIVQGGAALKRNYLTRIGK